MRRNDFAMVVAAVLLGALAAAAAPVAGQPAVAELRVSDPGCRALPVHTAALAEQGLLGDLGGLPLRGFPGLAPTLVSPWTPETRLSDRVRSCMDAGRAGPADAILSGGSWLTPLSAAVEMRLATSYPRAMADGSFRPGAGTMLGAVGGFAAGYGPLTLVVRPEVHHNRNASFIIDAQSIPDHSRYIHPTSGTEIDLPQRFGSGPFTVLSPGQSTLRLDWRGVAAGASTENAWWGPALRNPLLLSSAAPGFPHAFVGTGRPVDVRIGQLYLRTLVGRLTESEYFDDDPTNDHQLISGTIASFEPAPLPGLTLGLARFFAVQDGPNVGLGRFLRAAFTGFRENLGTDEHEMADNQHASVFARWAFPEAGLAVYGEFARIDHWGEWLELVKSPQAAGAWMAGVQKVLPGEARSWRVLAEAVNLVDPIPTQLPNRPGHITWYTHASVRQGHTHQGQLLGAPAGPGGRQQVIAIDRYSPTGDIGIELTRAIYNDDAYNQVWWRHFNVFGHDAELTALARVRRPTGPFDIHGALGYSRRWNRHFVGLAPLVGTQWELSDLRRNNNVIVEVRGVWVGW
jgi:hypothetical protein